VSAGAGYGIDNEAGYAAKIRRCVTTVCSPERCPRCGEMVGRAIKKDGKTYLAFLIIEERRGETLYSADKRKPHFKDCAGVPKPGVLCKGVRARVVKGRKVPVGTEGVVVWIGAGDYGERCGLKDDAGNVHWTALANVEPAPTPEALVVALYPVEDSTSPEDSESPA
jgi:hypothetical protein